MTMTAAQKGTRPRFGKSLEAVYDICFAYSTLWLPLNERIFQNGNLICAFFPSFAALEGWKKKFILTFRESLNFKLFPPLRKRGTQIFQLLMILALDLMSHKGLMWKKQ